MRPRSFLIPLAAVGGSLLALGAALAQPAGDPPPKLPQSPFNYRRYANDMLRWACEEKFWTWAQYPGLSARRETKSGLYLSQARNTVDAQGARWQTWSASYFNAPAAEYFQANLFPPDVLQAKVLGTGKVVRFPKTSIIVKALFTENVQPGMHVVTALIAKTQGGSATRGGHLVPSQMAEKPVGLLQLDIATKEVADWTWYTFSFQPGAAAQAQFSTAPFIVDATRPDGLPGTKPGTLALVRADGTYLVARPEHFTKEYRGPADNAASTCIGCHQHVQYPALNIGTFTADPAHKQKHAGPWPVLWPGETTPRDGVRLDYQWEAAQALSQWDFDEQNGLPHSTTAHPPKDPPLGGGRPGGGIIDRLPMDDFDNH